MKLWQATVVPLRKFYRAAAREVQKKVPDLEEGNILKIITVIKKWFRALYMAMTNLAEGEI